MFLGVDLQNDFIDGSFAVDGAVEMSKKLGDYLEKNYDKYANFALTADSHPYNHSSFKECGGEFPRHCVRYTKGAAFNDNIVSSLFSHNDAYWKVFVGYKGVDKDKEEFSIFQNQFYGSLLDIMIETSKINEIHVCGLVNEYCVYNTVKDLLDKVKDKNIKIKLLGDFILDLGNSNVLYDFAKENSIKII